MTLPDLERAQHTIKMCGEQKTLFQEKAGWIKMRALIGKIKPGFVIQRHGPVCNGRVIDNLCTQCNVPAMNATDDYYGFVTLRHFNDPMVTFEVPFATRAGGGLFGAPPNIMATRSRAELEALAAGLEMQPYKIVLKVKWDVGRGEVSYLAMNFKPIDTEGATYASSGTLAAYLGVAATLPA